MILFFYILKDYLKYVFGIIFLCIFLFVLFNFIDKTTNYFPHYKPGSKLIFLFYLYQIPIYITQSIPISSLIGSVVSMILLSRTNEITAMRAAGMGPLKISMPIAIGGLMLSLFSFVTGEFIVPIASKKLAYVKYVQIEGKPASEVIGGARWLRQGKTLYHFDSFEPIANELSGVKVIETGLNFRPKVAMESTKAIYVKEKDKWTLNDVKILYFNPYGNLAYTEKIPKKIIKFPLEPKKLQKEHRELYELSIKELTDIINKGTEAGIDVLNYIVNKQIKIAFHFAAFIVCLIGLRFGYSSERSVETAKGIIVALAVGISYWFLLNTGQAFGRRGVLPPIVAAWMGNVVIFTTAIISIWKTQRLH